MEKEKENTPITETHNSYLSRYAITAIRLFKLSVYEKTAYILSAVSYVIVLLCVSVVILFFLFMAMAVYIGEVWGSEAMGYAMMCMCAIVFLAVIISMSRRIKRYFINIFIEMMYDVNKNTDYEK
ncbi:MAG: hypothetical protein II371_04795 [Flavobacteriales bacterium]|nr:hypothetical protein [Flavobacteriales bacterium]